MKPAVVLFFLLSLLQNSSLGQTVRFTDTSNVWHIHCSYQEPGFSFESDHFIRYYDTVVINGYAYRWLNKGILDSALIREDTGAKRVYARMYNQGQSLADTSEVVLYDFSLQQGDTFAIVNPNFGSFMHVVDTITHISINGIMHKQWLMKAVSANAWDYGVIEGIGSVYPFFPYMPGILVSGTPCGVVCFRNAGIGVWSPIPSSDCMLAVENVPANTKDITIYPNPAKERVSIELPNQQLGKGSIILVSDCFGRKMLEMHPEPSKRVTQLSTSDWSPGVYNMLVRHSDGSFVSKNIVIVK